MPKTAILQEVSSGTIKAIPFSNEKFSRRFRMVEQLSKAAGKTVTGTDLDTLDLYWDEAKVLEAADHAGNATGTA